MRVLHFSSHYEDCGIAKYQENYLTGMENIKGVTNEFFNYSPYQTRSMSESDFQKVIDELKVRLRDFDILHIQHEFGFFRGSQFNLLISTAKQLNIKVVVTYHTSPDLIIIKKPLQGLGPRSIINYLKSYRHNFILEKIHIAPLLSTDGILVHNEYTLNRLVEFGVPKQKITIIPHPTYDLITHPVKTDVITKALNKQPGDIIFSTVGYIHRFKGADKAIKALNYLPSNYKLAILGGVKSDSDDKKLYDKLADLIVARDLQDRVYISGVIPSDDMLNSFIQETDFCVYPYNSKYYKGVGSGSLNLAFANKRPIVAYPVSTFVETNTEYGHITFTDSDSYYELAREILRLDIENQKTKTTKYAESNSWGVMSRNLKSFYDSL
jgi:glycosyltransferase involved in cell wall biosynthesis